MKRVSAFWRGLFDFVLPPRCAACRDRVEEPGHLCLTCFADIQPVSDPCCRVCGYPFDFAEADLEQVCAACLANPPLYTRCRSAALYGGQMRRLILKLKNGTPDAAPALVRLMAPALASLGAREEAVLASERSTGGTVWQPILVTPVPLHPRRLLVRRYNQALLLASGLARQSANYRLAPDILRRTRATAKQHGLGAAGRRRNVSGAFQIAPAWQERIKGQSVLLVDDVFTTGATLDACARSLVRAGAAQVYAVTAGRVDLARRVS